MDRTSRGGGGGVLLDCTELLEMAAVGLRTERVRLVHGCGHGHGTVIDVEASFGPNGCFPLKW